MNWRSHCILRVDLTSTVHVYDQLGIRVSVINEQSFRPANILLVICYALLSWVLVLLIRLLTLDCHVTWPTGTTTYPREEPYRSSGLHPRLCCTRSIPRPVTCGAMDAWCMKCGASGTSHLKDVTTFRYICRFVSWVCFHENHQGHSPMLGWGSDGENSD